MNENVFLQKLVGPARKDTPPDINVTDSVMRTLRAQAGSDQDTVPVFTWVASLAGAAAVIAVIIGGGAWGLATDPMMTALSTLTEGLL